MRRNRCTTLSTVALAAVGMLGLAGCDVDVPDLNNPALEPLENDPTAPAVAAACTGLLIGNRAATSGSATGYIAQLGVVGRESYNFDVADPRNFTELLAGSLSGGSPFGGAFWAAAYANMRLQDIILLATDEVADFDESQRNAIRGFVKTIRALDLLRVITTRDEIGAVIDTDGGVDQLGEIVSKEETLTEIARLLDEGAGDLADGGEEFPFALSNGYAGFTTPSGSFLQFNRAIRVRTAIYQEDYEAALAILPDTFINDAASSVGELERGVYHSFSTGSGDLTNALINPNIFAHPSVGEDAQEGDDRLARKVRTVSAEEAGTDGEVESNLKFNIYSSPDSPVAIIRNEELILFRAEAELFAGDPANAEADLNIIRTVSGQLDPVAGLDEDALFEELIYNRRYSLLYEGHRLIDVRRFDRVEDLPLDLDGHGHNVRWPLPSAECNARPGAAPCAMGSRL